MIERAALVAGVLAATDQVVQQATVGDWPAALQSSQDRRLLLEQLAKQEPQLKEHGFLRALREAATESDVALKKMGANTETVLSGSPAISRLCTKV
jgi:lipid A disaccharide synthetase